jgi:hypothetical protein
MFLDKIGSPPFPRGLGNAPDASLSSFRRSVNYVGNLHSCFEKVNYSHEKAFNEQLPDWVPIPPNSREQ